MMIGDEWFCRLFSLGMMVIAIFGHDLWGQSELSTAAIAVSSFVFMVGAMILKAIRLKGAT